MGSTPRTSFRLSSETLATLDARRGTTSRSEFVRRLIADAAATSPPRDPVDAFCQPVDVAIGPVPTPHRSLAVDDVWPPRFVPVESIDVVPHVVDVEPRFKAKGRGS